MSRPPTPREIEREWPQEDPLVVDLSQLGGPDTEEIRAAAIRILERYRAQNRAITLFAEIGSEGESRSQPIRSAEALWGLVELFGTDVPIELDLRFPRLPSTETDPLRERSQGPPRIPVSPLDSPPEQELALWELRTLRHLIAIRRDLSATRKVIINVTYRCNNHCSFCAVGNRLHEDGDYAFHRRMLVEHRKEGCDLVDLDGGEPMLYPDLLRLIAHSSRLGYREINVTTNGRLLAYPGRVEKLLARGVTSLLISCHGSRAATHDSLVNVPGAFEQTIKGIENVLACKTDRLDFGVNITLTQQNWKTLPEYFALMMRLGVGKLNIQFLTPFGRADDSLVPELDQVAALLKGLLDEYGDQMRVYLVNVPFCAFRGYEEYVTGDLMKLERNMVFVTQEKVNLFEYLAKTRKRTEVCTDCVFSLACDGFYDFHEVLS